jgi:hypothetical protein
MPLRAASSMNASLGAPPARRLTPGRIAAMPLLQAASSMSYLLRRSAVALCPLSKVVQVVALPLEPAKTMPESRRSAVALCPLSKVVQVVALPLEPAKTMPESQQRSAVALCPRSKGVRPVALRLGAAKTLRRSAGESRGLPLRAATSRSCVTLRGGIVLPLRAATTLGLLSCCLAPAGRPIRPSCLLCKRS